MIVHKFKEHDFVNTPLGQGTIVHVYPNGNVFVVEINNETYTFTESELSS